ncbi:hypothetical protein V8C42DRAFT_321460 [Trichoderma barbatum]
MLQLICFLLSFVLFSCLLSFRFDSIATLSSDFLFLSPVSKFWCHSARGINSQVLNSSSVWHLHASIAPIRHLYSSRLSEFRLLYGIIEKSQILYAVHVVGR